MATASGNTTFRSVNPATMELLAERQEMDSDQVERCLQLAQHAFEVNRGQTLEWRSERMLRLAQGLRADGEAVARLVTAEMGKPLGEAQAEVEKCATGCEFYAGQAPYFLADEPAPSDSPRSFVAYRPLGVVLAIMPWNYPLWQVIRFLAPTLMAGNAGLLKHAPNTFGCALELERLVLEAGFPEGSLSCLLVDTPAVAGIIQDRRVQAVTLTGSDGAGSRVAAIAGAALKKTVLELGGSDFFMVLEDADLERAVQVGIASRFQNAGQSCIAAKRFLVAETIADQFQERFVAAARALPQGDPTQPGIKLGPQARSDLRDRIHSQVRATIEAGAQLLTGGELPEGTGFYYPPTVLAGVSPGMAAFDQETFGPVAAITRFGTREEAVQLANHSQYGLGGNIWTGDQARGVRMASEMRTGGVFVNGMTHSDSRIPFGGVGRSGYGRELSHFGLREFTNIQTVWQA